MNQWSINRKRIILSLIIFVLIVLIGVPIFLFFNKAPTCFDNKQNGDETGVDCGGSCTLICTNETLPLIMKGDPRVLKVTDGVFEVTAYVQNPNVTGEVMHAPFTITLYTASSSVPLKVIQGQTFVPKNSSFGIFQGPFNFEAGVAPVRAVFSWSKDLVWQKNKNLAQNLSIKDSILSDASTTPRLTATLTNETLSQIQNIELVAFISDASGNIISASKTYINSLNSNESTDLVFTWPAPFPGQASTFEIIPRIFPDAGYIQ